jgi:flagellin
MSISSINSNLAAQLAQVNIGNATSNTSNDVSALSSGNRIVSAATDVAALAAGTGLKSQVNILTASISNSSQGSSLLQVADGALSQIQSILQRQQAIAASAASGSLSTTQLGFLNQEFSALTTEISNISAQTNFNGVNLIASGGTTLSFQVGTASSDTLQIKISGADTTSLSISSASVSSTSAASSAATSVQSALDTVTGIRATVGADEESFNFATAALTAASQNEGAAASNLLDTDVAAQSTQFATNQVQLQAGIAVLAQANQLQQNLLKLLA